MNTPGIQYDMFSDTFTARFEHIATTYPVYLYLNENEFKLMTVKENMDAKFDQALQSLWLRGIIPQTGGSVNEDIADFQENHFLEGVYKNEQLRSH